MNLVNLNPLIADSAHLTTVATTIVIVFIYLGINRYITEYRTGRNLHQELGEHDNFAYGLSYAGTIFAFLTIASEVFGQLSLSFKSSNIINMVLVGVLTIICIEAGRFIHDRLIMVGFDENEAINKRNLAGATIDAASVVANAIVVVAIFNWYGGHDFLELPIILVVYVIFQIHLLLLTRWREHRYAEYNQGESMQRTFKIENLAISIQHSGYLIALALAAKTTTQVLIYDQQSTTANLLGFTLGTLLVMILTIIIAAISHKIILNNINSEVEIGHQNNIGIATVEMSTLVAVALAGVTLTSH